jgi:UDP-galactose transporter B1
MARTKQATPLRRETSSEYFSKQDRTPRKQELSSNGGINAQSILAKAVSKPDNTIVQLVIAVAGIYGSL